MKTATLQLVEPCSISHLIPCSKIINQCSSKMLHSKELYIVRVVMQSSLGLSSGTILLTMAQ